MPCPPHSDLVTGPWPPGGEGAGTGAGCVSPCAHASLLLLAVEASTHTQKQREQCTKPVTLPRPQPRAALQLKPFLQVTIAPVICQVVRW